jgi:hypothetical protein
LPSMPSRADVLAQSTQQARLIFRKIEFFVRGLEVRFK